VSVAEGKVQVSRGKEDLLTLIKGQELRLAYNTVEQRDVVPVQIAAWQKGDYNFTDETLGDIIKDLQVYYGVTIRLENTRLTDLQLTTGIKKNTSVDSALANICELANANYTKKNDVYVVY
jgi:ferric-dicitrate binding protein FerR (iron transport regulator)